MLFVPELILLIGSLLIFGLSLGEGKGAAARKMALVLGILCGFASFATLGTEGVLFFASYQVNLFTQLLKLIVSLGMVAVIIFGGSLRGVNRGMRSEYYLFMVLSILGLMMLISSVELLALFISLELSSYALYLMVPMRDDSGEKMQMEAAIKYILFGVVSTGIMLYGMSYIYGLTGTTYFNELVPAMHVLAGEPVAILAIAMFMAGFFYKLAVFPFHFWVPDVYQGASNATTAFIATVPKIGAVAILIRITALIAPEASTTIVSMLMILALCSMFYGNLSALVQTDVKRMLGFSGISHAGFVMLGLITMKETGLATSLYYISGYVFMNLACFLVICKASAQGENLSIDSLSGLYKRAPLLALTLLVGMMALAGIPPFVGFMGKFMLLTGALKEGYLALVILAALNTAIAIYYYLSVVRVAFCNDPEDRPDIQVDGLTRVVSLALLLIIVYMGVAPKQIMALATSAVQVIF